MKSLIKAALRRPITILVIVGAVFFGSFLAIQSISIDIFPKLNLPVIYVIEPFAGMTPQQMEGFFSTRLSDQFLYVSGIKNISSKNIQGISILKLVFFEKTDMAQAAAEVAVQLNRSQQFFPPGALPPQVIRFDASSLPVGTLVFSSPNRQVEEILDLAGTRIRPMFSTIPGLSAPPPIGSNQRTVLINIDPNKLRSYNLTPDEVVSAMTHNNITAPSGNISIGNTAYMVTTNALEGSIKAFGDIPVKASDNASAVFLHDIATIQDGADVTTGYALVNGKRSIYMPVVKTPDASTWEVVQKLKAKLPEMQSLLPDDVHITYEFDQSVFVINSVKSIISEGVIGAILTALMILLFLRDWRSCIIVVVTIPLAIFSAVFLLKIAGQTINIMTLGGLALAIGILVDESTVTIENIHQHLEMGKSKRKAILEACEEIALPKLLILLSILAVFVPAGLMTGVPRAMFLPLSLAVGFAMISSFLLSQTLVPIISNWLLKEGMYQHHPTVKHGPKESAMQEDIREAADHELLEKRKEVKKDLFERMKRRFRMILNKSVKKKERNVALYLILVLGLMVCGVMWIGKDLLPKTNNGQYQVKLLMPEGTRLERTEAMVHDVLNILDSITGNHVKISSAYAGMMPPNYATSNLYVFNAGVHEASLQMQMDEHFKMGKDTFQELFRNTMHSKLPDVRVSFEPIELTEKIMSQGAATPIEVEVGGKNMADIEDVGGRLVEELKGIDFLRDVRIEQPLKYPTVRIILDRYKIAQMGLKLADVSRSVTDFSSSSRYTDKNLWLDTKSAYTYQVQAQVPAYRLNAIEDFKEIPLEVGKPGLVLQDVASFQIDTVPGEYDRSGPRRFITVSANLYKTDLGRGTAAVTKAIKNLGALPKGLSVEVKGMSNLLTETLDSLQSGLLLAVIVIFLLLSANYQSFRAALAVLSSVPAVLFGAVALLLLTGSTLNLQSYMGIIMAVGVSVANAILIVTNAEKLRFENNNNILDAAVTSASIRLRPILMTSLAMIAGMIPMASGLGEAGDQTAPLGRAIIGGLIASTIAALFIVPQCYALLQRKATLKTPSLLPNAHVPRQGLKIISVINPDADKSKH